MWQKDTVVDHRSTMMNTANNNKVMRTDRVLTTYKKPTSPVFQMIITCFSCVILIFCACNHNNQYVPSAYTKNEVLLIYQEKNELFENVVNIISTNEMVLKNGRINEYTDVDIMSPYDDALSCFSETEKIAINNLFNYKPYIILYDYAGRCVEISFLSADSNGSYSFLFWTFNGDNSNAKFVDYKNYLAQTYIIESITINCIMFYEK